MPKQPSPKAAQLGSQQRSAALRRVRDQCFDVVVIGGGVTGCGVALDAVTRGYTVAMFEARDFASGTSSRSSKLIHGGLRYLEMRDFALVREALRERGLLVGKLAPHLVRPVPFVLPLNDRWWQRVYIGAGLLLYDLLARLSSAKQLPWHRHLSKKGVLRRWPSLRSAGLRGGVLYFDAQVDDARHTLTVARTAAAYGAEVLSRCRVVSLVREGDRVVGVRVVDEEQGGEPFDVRARVVVNACGVWLSDLASSVSDPREASVRASKGVHLVVPRQCIDASTGLISRTEKSVLFVIPWGKHWIIGTTDTDWSHDKVHPAASRRDIEYVLDHVNVLLDRPIMSTDVQGVYAGLRPLVARKDASTAKLSREHVVSRIAPGLVGIAGGKYTTYRVMAKDVVDTVVTELGDSVRRTPSRTSDVPLLGACDLDTADADHLAQTYDLAVEHVRRLLGRYGSMVNDVLAPSLRDRSLLEHLPDTDQYIRAEVLYAVTHEGALHLEDVLTRRTRLSVESWSRGVDAARCVAEIMGESLGWEEARRTSEVRHYGRRVAAERAANQAMSDAQADLLRRQAGDIVTVVRTPATTES